MANLMASGTSGYATGAIDTATTQVDDSPNPVKGEASALKINGITSAIVQIETVLGIGTDLKGSKADLVERMAVEHNPDGTQKTLVTSRGGTGKTYDVVPPGVIWAYGGPFAPLGFLLCDGSQVSRTNYADLFAVFGTFFGAGDGTSTFHLPDLRGRVIVGVDGTAQRITSASTNGANADFLGGVGGSETHTLTTSELASHNHPLIDSDGEALYLNGGGGTDNSVTGSGSVVSAGALTTNNTGGGAAHSNTQPWMALFYIVKY